MSLFALLLGLPAPSPTIDALQQLATKRDVAGILNYAMPGALSSGAFQFLITGGVYGGGQRGWTVSELRDPVGQRTYAVFSTPLDCEDIGEQVFELKDDRILREIDELEAFNLKLTHHDMKIEMEPATSLVTIEDTATFKSSGASTPHFHLRFGPEWKVTSITTASGASVAYNQAAGTVSVARPKEPNFDLKFKYEAVLKDPSLEGKLRDDELMLAGACWWPSLARQASTTNMTLVSPPDWRSFAHGSRTAERMEGGKRVTTWSNPVPISVLSAVSGKYEIAQKKVGRFTYWSASIADPKSALELQNDINVGVVEFYDSLHPWPYPSWGSLISQRFPGGALEAYSFATYARGWLPDIDAHEPAHTHFGGVIPNTYLRSLWNESFASYCENYYLREGLPGNRPDLRRAFVEIPDVIPSFRAQPAMTAGAETGSSASSIGYGRGGLVLDMLEKEIGEAAMKLSIQTWLKEHPKGSTGEWEDFEKVVIRVAKRDVRWFFDQWLRRAGWADFEITDVSTAQRGAEWITTGTLRFQGTAYRLRPEVLITDAEGRDTLVTLPLTTGRSSETLKIVSKTKPKSVTFDPWSRIMRDYDRAKLAPAISGTLRTARPWVRTGDEAMADQLLGQRPRAASGEFPTDLNRRLIIADPRKSPEAMGLLRKMSVPPVIQGSRIIWRGQSVELSKGGFAALIELGDGQRCTLMFGNVRLRPAFGQASAVLFDDLGRPKAATRMPTRDGALHFNLP